MGEKTLANIRDRMSKGMGDYITETVTTAINADNVLVDTNLTAYTSNNDFFNRKWCLITSHANIGVNRKISDYVASTKTLTVLGAALADDSANLATFQIHAYNPDNKTRAINEAARECFGDLFRKVEWDDTLVLGNWLPDRHFETWDSASALTWWSTESNTTLVRTTAAANIRGGKYSVKSTASGASGYFATNSDTYPGLIGLQGQRVDLHSWVNPQTADDAKMVIYTKTVAGVEVTETSTTTNPAGTWSKISISDYDVPDNLSKIEIRMVTTTSGQYVYFDKSRLTGPAVYDYLAPAPFQIAGEMTGFREQTSGNESDICDDVTTSASQTKPRFDFTEYEQGGYKYIRTSLPGNKERKLIIQGYAPLEDTLSADTDIMTIDDPHMSLLAVYATYRLYEMEAGMGTSEDMSRLKGEAAYWYSKYQSQRRYLKMEIPQSTTRFRMD